jgi:integrase
MYIVKKWSDKMPTDKNYLDVTTHKFIFCKYKTAKKHGIQMIDIPEPLWKAIDLFLKYHPLWKGVAKRKADPVKLLVQKDGTPMTAVNAITRVLNRIFGRKLGSSMIRHIFISDKYGDLINEQKSDADAMAHSVGQQRDYYKKNDDKPVNEIIVPPESSDHSKKA